MRRYLAIPMLLALLVAACGGTPPAASTAPSATAAATSAADAAWAATVDAAKKEGVISVWGPTGPDIQQAVTDGFQKAYGIKVQWQTQTGNEAYAKIKAEYAAGQYTVDFVMDGASTMSNFINDGLLQTLPPLLTLPEVTDTSKWRGGSLRYLNDDPQKRVLVTALFIPPPLVVNTTMVKPEEINTTWQRMLDPKWTGKIASFDPRIPSHSLQVSMQLLNIFGEDYYRKLYLGQKIVLSADDRQVAEWVARGTYAMALGVKPEFVEPFRTQGLPIAVVKIKDFAGYPSGGAVQVGVPTKSPHPNSSKVFLNWLASKDGQSILMKAFKYASGRLDVATDFVPDYVVPKDGETYGLADWGQEFRSKSGTLFGQIRTILGTN